MKIEMKKNLAEKLVLQKPNHTREVNFNDARDSSYTAVNTTQILEKYMILALFLTSKLGFSSDESIRKEGYIIAVVVVKVFLQGVVFEKILLGVT